MGWKIRFYFPFALNFFCVISQSIFSTLLRAMTFFSVTLIHEVAITNAFRFTIKRAVTFLVISNIVIALVIWNHIGFVLDDILYPEWKDQPVTRPIFIIGNARSGTTWIHRMITLEDSYFTTMKTWEILFAASVSWRKLFSLLFRLDKRWLRGRLFVCVLQIESMITKDNSSLHRIGLLEAEEDEWIMLHIFASQLMMLIFPVGGTLLNPLVNFDLDQDKFGLPSDVRIMIMGYYRDCVKRHLFSKKKRLVFVSKNPAFTMRIKTLYHLFPDARVVCLVRDPVQSVPSMVSYIAHVRVPTDVCWPKEIQTSWYLFVDFLCVVSWFHSVLALLCVAQCRLSAICFAG